MIAQGYRDRLEDMDDSAEWESLWVLLEEEMRRVAVRTYERSSHLWFRFADDSVLLVGPSFEAFTWTATEEWDEEAKTLWREVSIGNGMNTEAIVESRRPFRLSIRSSSHPPTAAHLLPAVRMLHRFQS